METIWPDWCAHSFLSPSSWITTNYILMIVHGEGRSPMTSSDAETDYKPNIIIIVIIKAVLNGIMYIYATAILL